MIRPCAYCGAPTQARDGDGDPVCGRGRGCTVLPPRRTSWVPDVGRMTEEELLTAAVTCCPRGE